MQALHPRLRRIPACEVVSIFGSTNDFACCADGGQRAVGENHDRMPVILPLDAYDRWLANIEPDPRDLLVPFQS